MTFLDALRIALRNLREARLFFVANVVAVAVGVFLVVILLSLATGIRRYVEGLLRRDVGATMIELSYDRRVNAAPLTEQRIQQFAADQRVAVVTPVVQGVFGELRPKGGNESMVSLWSTTGGSDPETGRYAYLAGSPTQIAPESILISQAVAGEMGIFPAQAALGRKVTLRITRGGAGGQQAWEVPLTVTAVARETRFSRCYVALNLMRSIASWQAGAAPGSITPFIYDTALLYARRVEDVPAIRHDLEARGYRTASILDTVKRYREITRLIAVILGSLGGIALFTGSVSIFNTAWAAVLRRVKEFAVYKTYGATRASILTIVLIEAVVTSAVAAVFGFGGAAGGGLLIRRFLITDAGFDLLPIEWPLLATAFVVSALACVAASLWPAVKAARLSPAEALRSS